MCRHVHVRLSEADRAAVSRLRGVLLPVYASIGLAVLAAVAVSAGRGSGEAVAVADAAPAAAHPPVTRAR